MAARSSPVIFQNAAGRILADPAGFLRTYWAAEPRTLPETQVFLRQLSQALRQRGWSRVLINQVGMRAFSPAEQHWITQEWLPQAVAECGYRHGAVVLSADTYTRLAMAFVTTSVGGLALRYRSFDDEAAAVAWLGQQPG